MKGICIVAAAGIAAVLSVQFAEAQTCQERFRRCVAKRAELQRLHNLRHPGEKIVSAVGTCEERLKIAPANGQLDDAESQGQAVPALIVCEDIPDEISNKNGMS